MHSRLNIKMMLKVVKLHTKSVSMKKMLELPLKKIPIRMHQCMSLNIEEIYRNETSSGAVKIFRPLLKRCPCHGSVCKKSKSESIVDIMQANMIQEKKSRKDEFRNHKEDERHHEESEGERNHERLAEK